MPHKLNLVLKGDENVPDMPISESEVNHLRRVLAWLSCEYNLHEGTTQIVFDTVNTLISKGLASEDDGSSVAQNFIDKQNQVPAYVRQGVKMLTKAVQKHDSKSIVDIK